VVATNDRAIERLFGQQITDRQSPLLGGFKDEFGLPEPHLAGAALETYTAGFLHADSHFHADRALAARIQSAAHSLRTRQHPDGFVDLLQTNFHSPPDTAFVVHNVATAACLLKRAGEGALYRELEPFLVSAARGLVTGGVHTANHRWVVSSALAQLYELFRDESYVRRIDQWLAEGVDIDSEGQFTERSTSIYNAVCDRAFVVMSHKLNRPEMLDAPRRNVAAMMFLLHDDFEVVSEISRRQDQYSRAGMGRYWFSLRYLAMHDANGALMSLVDHLEPDHARLSALMEYPQISGNGPERVALPTSYERHLPEIGIVRYRDAALSATLLSDNPVFFTLRNGDAVISSVSLASAFFGKGQFIGSSLTKADDGFSLEQSVNAGYWQPFTPARVVPVGRWGASRPDRVQTNTCKLEQAVTLRRIPGGFRLRIMATGTSGVPVVIRVGVSPGSRISGCERHVHDEHAWILSSKYATVSSGKNSIRFGPGKFAHSYTQPGASLRPQLPGTPIYLTAFTPVDHSMTFELD
jgi:hypothetical protein